jgi:LysR family glycine cleavage system transcriptional activator
MVELPLNALRAFALVYEHGGIRRAARELGVSHSALSRHVAELEAWLGVDLAEAARGRAGRRFTPQGEVLGRAASAALGDLERVCGQIREARSSDAVVISTTASIAVRWLLPRLARFERRYPRRELSIVVDQRLVDVERDGIDLAVRMGRGPWPGVDCEPLMDDALYPVASPSYWRGVRTLARAHLLHDRDPNAAWELWRTAFGPPGLDVRRGSRLTSSDLVLRAATEGIGVALARHRLAAAEVASGALVRPFGDREVRIPDAYWLVVRTHGRSHRGVADAIAWLVGETR